MTQVQREHRKWRKGRVRRRKEKGWRKVGSTHTRYVGEFLKGKRHGSGEVYFPSGKNYEGEFKDGIFFGKGTMTETDGRKYVGGWQNNIKQGLGELFWPDGKRFSGEFKSDLIEGVGIYTFPKASNMAKIEVKYNKGQPVDSCEEGGKDENLLAGRRNTGELPIQPYSKIRMLSHIEPHLEAYLPQARGLDVSK